MALDVGTGLEPVLVEDPLNYLPRSTSRSYAKGEIIYDFGMPKPDLYLVVEGYVKITRTAGTGEIVTLICQVDDLFGECVFIDAPPGEQAVAIEPSQIMNWPVTVIRDLMMRRPSLGVAFIQWLAGRCLDLSERIATLSHDSTARRLAKALIHLSEPLGRGERQSTEARRLPPFSHKLLAQYVGTTREAVTHCMNQFRRQGCVAYSRRDLMVDCDLLRQWLAGEATGTSSTTLSERSRHNVA